MEKICKKKGQISEALRNKGKSRTNNFVDKITTAMRVIEIEIEQNEGLYPGGALNIAELCRRADVNDTTLYNPTHKEKTLPFVDKWLKLVLRKMYKGSKAVRKEITNRVEDWKERHAKVATHYHICNIELENRNDEIAILKKKIEALEAEVIRLRGGA